MRYTAVMSSLSKTFLQFILAIALVFAAPAMVFAQDGDGNASDAAAAADGGGAEKAADAGGDSEAISKGEAIFNQNCKQCHAINEQVVGPALKGSLDRWGNDRKRLINFIRYPQRVIDGGDAYAQGLYKKYQQYMPNHDFLEEAEVDNILTYIVDAGNKKETAEGPSIIGDPPVPGGGGADSGLVTLILVGLLVVLGLLVMVLILIVNMLKNIVDKKEDVSETDKEYINSKINWGGIFGHPAFRGIVTFVFVVVVAKAGFDQVYGVGIQQGYAPTQPIPFSHKLHAGVYEIDCNYCHTGAKKGKSATIPSTNICLNCHNKIKTNSPYIKKLWAAANNDQPVEWVRIHNLPDLAYFNHQQHVVVGGIECQTCHGAIEEMEVVRQHSTLTMGWCINCHRETVVKAEGNAYYDNLLQLHNSTYKGAAMTVESIGGLECSKCHY